MRLVLIAACLATGCGPAVADTPRCMAMASVRTADKSEKHALRDGQTIGPVLRAENNGGQTFLCSENRLCYPAKDFDLVTPCTIVEIRSGVTEMR